MVQLPERTGATAGESPLPRRAMLALTHLAGGSIALLSGCVRANGLLAFQEDAQTSEVQLVCVLWRADSCCLALSFHARGVQ